MNVQSDTAQFMRILIVIGGVTAIVGMLCLLITMGRRYLGLSHGTGWMLGMAITAASLGAGIYRGMQMSGRSSEKILDAAFTAGFLVFCGFPLAIKVYRAWIGAYATESEKLPGTPGIRAWLSPANLILALVVSFCASHGFGYPFFGVFGLILLLLLAYPIANTISQNPVPAEPSSRQESLTTERERVLSMLDAGKITAEESAELLNALAATVQQPERDATKDGSRAMGVEPGQRMLLLGAALVLAGFFLPWFSINPGRELERVTGQISSTFNNMAQQFGTSSGMNNPFGQNGGNPGFAFKTATVNITGGDIGHGLGWLVLLLSVGVAILPFLPTNLDARTGRTIDMLALGGGLIVLLYLLTNNIRFLNIGIVLAIAGYLIEFAAVIRHLPAFRVQKEIRL